MNIFVNVFVNEYVYLFCYGCDNYSHSIYESRIYLYRFHGIYVCIGSTTYGWVIYRR